jgi:hypothetical protein
LYTMKKLLLIFSLILFPAGLFAQIQDESERLNSGQTVHSKRDVSISASPNILFNTLNGTLMAGGLKLRVFAGERFSFDTDMMFGRNFVQLAPGIVGLPAILLGYELGFGSGEEDNTFTEFLIMGALILLSVEHFAYHIPVKYYTDISPYVSLLRFRQFTNVTNSENTDGFENSACFAVGLEVNKYFKKFVLSPYADYSIGYSGPIRGFTCGINFGYYLSYK